MADNCPLTDADTELLGRAKQAQEYAHAPYSGYRVGAAVRGGSGAIYAGCNVEISSFSLTCCAERVAVFKAISEGEKEILSVAVVTDDDPPGSPCGACRQVLVDFGPTARVVIGNDVGVAYVTDMATLMPNAFRPQALIAHMQRQKK